MFNLVLRLILGVVWLRMSTLMIATVLNPGCTHLKRHAVIAHSLFAVLAECRIPLSLNLSVLALPILVHLGLFDLTQVGKRHSVGKWPFSVGMRMDWVGLSGMGGCG